mgnify:FL=1
MLEKLMKVLDSSAEKIDYDAIQWEEMERKLLIVDADSVAPIMEDKDLFGKFLDIVEEFSDDKEYFDEYTLYEFSSFDVIIMGDCIH